jgi:ribosomal protein S18 acetylase RimI-like enzyme
VSNLIIRELKKDEYNTLINIWKRSGLPHRPEGRDMKERILKEMDNHQSKFLAADLENQVVGVVLVTHDGRKGWINRLAVLPEFRDRGIATRLMDEAEESLRLAGIGIFACLIEEWNDGSMEFFSHKGYIKHDKIKYFTKRDYPEV